MKEEENLLHLIHLKTKFEELATRAEKLTGRIVDPLFRISSSDIAGVIVGVINDYNNTVEFLSVVGLEDIRDLTYTIPEVADFGSMYKVITNSSAATEAINALIPQKILSELANKLKDFRERLEAIEDIDPNIYKNLDKAILEMEHGHYLASALISARVVVWILQQIPPEEKDLEDKTRKKIETLINMGIIDKSSKDEIKKLIQAAGFARNFVSRRISVFPEPEDAMVLLGNAVKLAKIYTEFKKREVLDNGW